MKRYSCKQVQSLINRYIDKGGQIVEIEQGVLGYGTIVCFGDGLKTAVVKEQFINAWASDHKVTLYSKMPKKYELMIEAII